MEFKLNILKKKNLLKDKSENKFTRAFQKVKFQSGKYCNSCA